MSVYVDPLFETTNRSSRWPYNRACHMFADSLDELHALASKIGLRRAWFQNASTPHYDLTEKRRAAALKAGAIELPRRIAVEKIRTLRAINASQHAATPQNATHDAPASNTKE